MECAAVCYTAAQLMSMNSEKAKAYCRLCAEFCRDCAAECAHHDHEHCRTCADACNKCADECERMAA
jgi:hypothetical protein